MTNAIRPHALSGSLAAALVLVAIARPSFAEPQAAPIRYEYAALYQQVDGPNERWRFASADADTGSLELDAFAKALGLPTTPALQNTRIVNLIALKGWELVTHARSQSPARWFYTQTGGGGSTSSSLTFTEIWHLRRTH